ncbi:hypothetical protein K6Y31_00550 [Motilimonas cestriensis]|uniref:Lipoprotein n=1 Tax=Motilimonas cestriensis TaxID=2742685 RepID=A0ABS8W300_9GAMM|nr:hypothetical protein [Motilimonas cestriensis]MCE2593311.1 hypothetical protein [Motilimonas cestriensis]
MQPQRTLVAQGQFGLAADSIEPGSPTEHNHTLLLLEKGRAQFLAQQWQQSLETFKQADAVLVAQDKAAQYRLSQGINQLSTAISNDNAIIYAVPSYERTLLHHYLALNYLALQQPEAALVEIRRANLQQEKALAEHQVWLQSAVDKAKQNGILADTQSALNAYPDMSGVIGELKNGYQNAYTFYFSALLYDAAREYNSAYIDYKRALEITPDNIYVQRRLFDLANQLNMVDDIAQFERDFRQLKPRVEHNTSTARVVFLIESGLIAAKQEVRLPVPIRSSDGYYGVFNVAMPVYQPDGQAQSFSIIDEGRRLDAAPIAKLTAMAAKQLQEDLTGQLIRQGIRLFAKEMLRQKVAKEAGDWGNLLINLYNMASETADTRSWSLLPNEALVIDTHLALGQHGVILRDGRHQHPIDFKVQAGKLNLVLISVQNSGITSQVFPL